MLKGREKGRNGEKKDLNSLSLISVSLRLVREFCNFLLFGAYSSVSSFSLFSIGFYALDKIVTSSGPDRLVLCRR